MLYRVKKNKKQPIEELPLAKIKRLRALKTFRNVSDGAKFGVTDVVARPITIVMLVVDDEDVIQMKNIVFSYLRICDPVTRVIFQRGFLRGEKCRRLKAGTQIIPIVVVIVVIVVVIIIILIWLHSALRKPKSRRAKSNCQFI